MVIIDFLKKIDLIVFRWKNSNFYNGKDSSSVPSGRIGQFQTERRNFPWAIPSLPRTLWPLVEGKRRLGGRRSHPNSGKLRQEWQRGIENKYVICYLLKYYNYYCFPFLVAVADKPFIFYPILFYPNLT